MSNDFFEHQSLRKNSTGDSFTRPRINLIEGTNISLVVADDPTDGEVDVTISGSAAPADISDKTYLTLVNEGGALPNARQFEVRDALTLVDGGGGASAILDLADVGTPGTYDYVSSITTNEKGQVVAATAGSPPLADITGASFITIANEANLSNERALAVSSDLTKTDSGANSSVTIGLANKGTAGTYAYPSSIVTDTKGQVTSVTAGSAPPADISGKSYVCIANETGLSAERALAVTSGDLTLTDGGVNSSVTLGLAAVGVTAATYQGPFQAAVDSKGRLTSVTKVFTIQPCFYSSAPSGYLLLQGGTIGDASSGGTKRANADTVDLFTHLWTNLADAQAPVSSGRGASAAADFAAHKTITLPNMRQRFPLGLAASGTGSTLGGTGGTVDHTHTVPAHYHAMGTGADLNITASGSHSHNVDTYTGAGIATSYINKRGSTTDSTQATQTATHTHASGNFAGKIGLVTGGVDGNAAMTSGSENPAFLTMNFMINL